jgi:hypothetical protein
MSESPANRVLLLENILTLTAISIGLSSLIYFSADTLPFPFDFARQVALLTIVYHSVVLILSHFRHSPTQDASNYESDGRESHMIMRPAIGIATFLVAVWLVVIVLMITNLIFHFISDPWWWGGVQLLERIWAQFVLGMVETGVLMYMLIQCRRARRADSEGRVQI